MDHCRIKIPRILPEIFPSGGQQQYTAACPRLKTKTKHLKKNSDGRWDLLALWFILWERRQRQEVVDKEFQAPLSILQQVGRLWFERAEVPEVFSVHMWVQVERSWKSSAKLNLMSGASKSDLAQHVTQSSASPEVHSTYYLITGLNYRYRQTCPRHFPFGNS